MTRLLCFLLAALPILAVIPESDRATIDAATGAKGSYTAGEDVYRVTFPRSDVKVTIEGRAMHPFMGLTSWAAFTPGAHGGLMLMGDLVLFEDEVNAAMSAAFEAGLEVTALHNHFFYESPRVMFMHIGGNGSAEQLAAGVRRALDRVQAIRQAAPQPASRYSAAAVPETNSIDAAALDAILGVKGQANAGMYKALIGRQALMHGKAVGNQMGVNTWAAFAGTGELAFVDGDFAVQEAELQPVLRSLRQSGVNIVAIHNHMTHEEPQYIFLHYWGKGPATVLARALRAALDAQQPKANVVFVCEHGAAKSVVAAEYFNRLARERGLPLRAVSRGTVPDAAFNPAAVAGLKTDGFPALSGAPSPVEPAEASAAQRVVTFDVKLPGTVHAHALTQWNQTPSVSQNYPAFRDAVRARVEALLAELQRP